MEGNGQAAWPHGADKVFSFFSGSGFLDLGFEKSGFDVVFADEFYQPFLEAYQYAREQMGMGRPTYGCMNADVDTFLGHREQELCRYIQDARSDGSLVGFVGGPPCPDFSVAGKNRGREGDKGRLSASYVSLIIRMGPDFFLFENVKGLWKTARHRAFYEELKGKLHQAGYLTTERLTNAMEFGAPQDRDRTLLFGVRGGLCIPEDVAAFPWEKHIRYPIRQAKSCPWPGAETFVCGGARACPEGIPHELTVEHWFRKNDVKNHPNAGDYFQPKQGLTKMRLIQEGDVSRKSYKRLHRWRYSPTAAYGNNEVHLHPYQVRRISVAEALAIQSLPKEFALPPGMTLTDKFKTAGNGVPYLMAEGVAKSIHEFLDGCARRHYEEALDAIAG